MNSSLLLLGVLLTAGSLFTIGLVYVQSRKFVEYEAKLKAANRHNMMARAAR